MTDEEPNQEEATQRAGILARMARRAIDAGLFAIDAGLRALQGLRHRIEPPVADAEATGMRGKRNRPGGDEPPAIVASPPPRKTLLRRFLTIVMCLLIGGVAGMLISYRGFSRQIESQQKRIDHMQDEITQALRDEARSLGEKRKLQREIVDYRDSLNEARQEITEHQRQIAELNAQLSTARQPVRAADRSGPPPKPVAAQPRTAPKTGTCVTGGANSTADLLDCISKLNRP